MRDVVARRRSLRSYGTWLGLFLAGFLASVITMSAPHLTRSAPADESAQAVRASAPHARERPTAGGVRLGIFPPRERGPFLQGEALTLSEAASRAGFHLYRPSDPLASDGSLKTVWFEAAPGHTPHVALEYESGVLITLDEAVFQPESHYRELARRLGLREEAVRTVHGVPALVIPQDSPVDARRNNPASVDLVLEGVHITVYGQYGSFEIDDLVRIAESLA